MKNVTFANASENEKREYVSKTTIVSVNPDYVSDLQDISFDDQVSYNLSQRSDTSTSEIQNPSIPLPLLIASVKRDLDDLNKKEDELKIKKVRLLLELETYEAQLARNSIQ